MAVLAVVLTACAHDGDADSPGSGTTSGSDRPGLTAAPLPPTTRLLRPQTKPTSATTTSIARGTTTTLAPTTTTSLSPAQVAARLRPSVVGVRVVLDRTADQVVNAVGTGVVFRKDGLIVTNNHVVTGQRREAGSEVWVTLSSGRRLQATVVGRDPDTDLALLRVELDTLVPALFRTDLSRLAPGDPVVALGNAEYLERPVTSGRVTAILEGTAIAQVPGLERFIQADAPIAQGNSGGPLADAQGRVIGINVGIPLHGDEVETPGEVAIPADVVVETATRLWEGKGLDE